MFARSILHLSPHPSKIGILSALDFSDAVDIDRGKGKGFGFSVLRWSKLSSSSSSICSKVMEESGRSVVRSKGSGSEDAAEISGASLSHCDGFPRLFVGDELRDFQLCQLILMDWGKCTL